MTKEQALKELVECQSNGDTECAHSWADHILCEFLKHLGHEDIVTAWEAITPKWYA